MHAFQIGTAGWPLHIGSDGRGPKGRDLKGKLVVVTEDCADHRKALREAVEEFGGTVYSARTAAAAFKWIRSKSIDCLILDLGLPDMSGTDLIDWLIEEDLGLPVVSVSETAKGSHGHKMKTQGVFAVLDKPVNKTEVARTVQRAIQSNCRISRAQNSEYYLLTRIKNIIDEEILPSLERLPSNMRKTIGDGRTLLRQRNPDREKLSGFMQFLGNPLTHRTMQEVGIAMAVHLLEDLYR